MYAQVVVLTYQPPNVDSYTYKIPESLNLEIGQLVEVPFGKRNPQGIVISTSNQKPATTYQIKSINKVLFTTPILLPYQIKLLKWISEYYLAPMVDCLNAFLPEIPKRLENYEVSKNNNYQSLILVPTINLIPETLAKFPKAKNHIVYHNEMKMSQRFSAWLKILGGNTDYVFGSRATIFAPAPNLKEIIIYDEHDSAYKDQRSPYFDTLTVAQIISALTKAQIKIVDSSPKITTYFQLKNNIKMQNFKIKSKVIPLAEEKFAGNYSPIANYIQSELRKKQEVLLFLNKKKESGSMYCKSCKFNDYFEKQPQNCPKCKSADIFFNVLNIQSLKAEIQKFTKSPDVDIQTAAVFYAPKIKKYDSAVYVQPDSLVNRADFASVETLYAQISSLKKLLKENGRLLIQTYNPDDEIIKNALTGNYESFYKTQLEYRRLLKYPPHVLLIKLTVKGKYKEKIEELAHDTASILRESDAEISGPYEPIFFSKVPTFNIIIKYKVGTYGINSRKQAIEKLAPLLKSLDKKVQINVEPASLN